MIHRIVLVFRMPQLMIIDGIPVTDEERNKAEMYFADQMPVRMFNNLHAQRFSFFKLVILSLVM
jgi:hypothetical protein